jgi:Flp pilus assembly protein TadD
MALQPKRHGRMHPSLRLVVLLAGGLAGALLTGCSAGGSSDLHHGAAGVGVADAALDNGMPQTALNIIGAILQSDPRNVGALVRQGAALAQLNQPDAAIEAYRRALAVDPTTAPALLGLGRLQLARGSAADAEHSFTLLLVTRPDDRTALNDLGVALDLQGRHVAAQEVYARLLRLAPENLAASVNLALSFSLSGQADRSVAMLRGPASQPDATPRVRQDLAVALALSGNPREAETLLLTDLSPGDAAAALLGYQALDATKK